MSYKQPKPVTVIEGGTQVESFVAYTPVTGGTTNTGPLQSVASLGSLGQVLTSNGVTSLPSFKSAPGGDTDVIFDVMAGDPAAPSDGDVWFDTVSNDFQGQANGTAITFNVT